MAHFTKSDYKFFDMARREAEKSDYEPFKLGSVLVYKGHVVSCGHNSNKTNPAQKRYNKFRKFNRSEKPVKHSVHAEIDCLSSIPYPIAQQMDFSKAKIYVVRLSDTTDLGVRLARPCAGCRKALLDKGIRHLYYSGDDSFVYERMF